MVSEQKQQEMDTCYVLRITYANANDYSGTKNPTNKLSGVMEQEELFK